MRTIMPSIVTSCRLSSGPRDVGDVDAVLAGLLERLADLARIDLDVRVPVALSLNAKMISVPPLKSIVQFMYSPRTRLVDEQRRRSRRP